MFVCSCGCFGMNLKPDKENDQALCPKCGQVFAGVPADKAVIVPPEEEDHYIARSKTGIYVPAG